MTRKHRPPTPRQLKHGYRSADKPDVPAARQRATDRYIDGFLAGQAVAYCEMVCRGVRLAGQLDVPAQACAELVALVQQEGCVARVVSLDRTRAAVWIYRDKRVERLIEALHEIPMPSDIAIWSMGKLFGYADADVLDFLASTSVSAAESSPRLCSGKLDSDTGSDCSTC